MARQYDVIVFGASGFTGKYVALEVAKSFIVEGKTWAIAGRSQTKLNVVLDEIKRDLGMFFVEGIRTGLENMPVFSYA